jgi:7-carboxy-7-deazaguanine synthase
MWSGEMQINSIFNSIDGEVNYYGQGSLTTFIRLQGCNLRCAYCDTPQAQVGGGDSFEMTPSEIFKKIKKQGVSKITITGGEPLNQRKELIRLLEMINRESNWDCRITVETNGSKSLKGITVLASWVVDYKLPSSGMEAAMNHDSFFYLGPHDVVKFVIADKKDFNAAIVFIEETWSEPRLSLEFPLLAFSPVIKRTGKKSKPVVTPQRLMSWLFETRIPKLYRTALNIQLHKIIGLP